MPYALKNRCVIRADTGAIVKCHRTRARALKHLVALQINVPEMKADAERTPMTRAEAARHASLVRWKKESAFAPQTGGMSNPKIRARVAEILAAKQKKAKGKGGKGAKPKQSAEQKKAEKAKQRTATAEEVGVEHADALSEFAHGGNIDPESGAALFKQGLVTTDDEGSFRMSPAGRKFLSAAEKGDKGAARDAVASGREALGKAEQKEQARGEREQAREAKKQERVKAKAERVAAQAKNQSARQAKMKQAAAKQKAKVGAAKEKPKAVQEKADREKAAQEKADREQGDLLASVADNPKKIGYRQAGDLERAGLIEKTSDGYQLTDKGKEKIAKRQKDIDAAKSNAGKALDMSELAIKAGARHSRTDMQHIQAIHDSSVACGADCATDDETDDEMDMDGAEKAIKGIMDDPLYYAQHECSDIMQAANALSTLCMLMQSELAEDDEDPAHIMMLCDACRTLVQFIDAEVDECEQSAKDAAHDAGMGPMKAITEREDVNPKAGIAEYGKVDFADMKNKKYPIDTADHVRAAWNYIAKEANAAKYDPDEVAQIKAKIVAAWKKLIDKAGPPSAGKAIDDDWLHIEGDAIKALDNDVIRGYAVRFGDADHPDLQKDYYTKATDFWLDHFGWPRPITYHHGMDAGTRNDPVIGHWIKAGVDEVGVWMEGQMDRAHAYYKAMKELAQRGYLRLSSDSAPQWVIREKQQNGVNEIKRWPLVTSSVTVTPMEPRMLPVEVKAFLAELGFEGIDDSQEAINPDAARGDGLKAADDERARVLLLELDLLELETA